MSVEDEIARFEWSRIRTYIGFAEMVPDVLRGLIAAPDAAEASRLRDRLERILLWEGNNPCEGCAPVANVLVAALPEMTPAGHTAALDILAVIAAAEAGWPARELIGTVDLDEIRRAVAGGFEHYLAVLGRDPWPVSDLYSCIALMDALAFHDRSLVPAAVAALEAVRTGGRASGLADAIENTLADLADPST
ncbi:hypothetical protein ACIBSW_23400 [Actinoplanes sp. NPDC049668]|uniref:hypothetical protein n=1 Tax=unclassified Actinoplanes TaxID=2626549 RepID=UPI0033AFCD66